MPIQSIGDTSCYYRLDGRDDRPVVVLSHSLGQDHTMWDPQAADLSPYFRVLRYDTRGHGASGVTTGDYTIEQLGGDVLALTDRLGIGQFAFCGLSLGGMIGQWLAASAPERVSAVVLANTSARADRAGMEARRTRVLAGGMSAVADTVMERFFSAALRGDNPPVVAASRRVLLATDPVGYAGCCAAIRDMDHTSLLARIGVPCLIIGSERDPSLPWTGHSDILAREIAHARTARLDTAHLSNLEAPRAFSDVLLEFLGPADIHRGGELR
jgi:3-oxoadipate enol-lactonase